MLARAQASIDAQTVKVDRTYVAVDTLKQGAAATRNQAVRAALAEVPPDAWIGLLDDDDVLLPHHVELLTTSAEAAGVGVVWGWYEVVGGSDPLPDDFRGRPYDPDAAHCTPITYMARAHLFADALENMGGFVEAQAHTGYWSQDQHILSHMVRLGGHLALPDTTWHWVHHRGNTSGKPWK